jgi:hypothetical protein
MTGGEVKKSSTKINPNLPPPPFVFSGNCPTSPKTKPLSQLVQFSKIPFPFGEGNIHNRGKDKKK